jgi:lantibiotic modifying enzyme
MRQRRPHAPTDAEVKRIARDLQSFLGRNVRAGKRRSRWQSKSIDHALAPVCRFAVERLRQRTGRAQGLVAKTVWSDLERNLSDRLTFVLGPTFRFYLRAIQALGGSSPQPSRSWIDVFTEFPGTLETTARLISGWAEAQTQLLARVARDSHQISSTFFGKKQASRVTHLDAGLSDPHNGGRTVTLLQFADRNRIIYKPRACDGELFWFEALRWLNRNGLGVSFQIPRTLLRKNYAWVEFLARSASNDLRDVRLFYFGWGAQAALAQVLGATDLHRGNWLAVGAQPILLDAESIGESEVDSRGENAAQDRHLPAILRTGLLPLIARDRVGFYRSVAPFDDLTISNTGTTRRGWPRYRGAIRRPSRYVKEIAAGFSAVAQLFAAKQIREAFFKDMMPRMPKNRRLLLRATRQYFRLLCGSLEPRRLFARGGRWRWLVQRCCASAIDRKTGIAEARSLLCCDIPRFTARRSVVDSREAFSKRVAELNQSLRLLCSRVRLSADQSKTNRSPLRICAADILQ